MNNSYFRNGNYKVIDDMIKLEREKFLKSGKQGKFSDWLPGVCKRYIYPNVEDSDEENIRGESSSVDKDDEVEGALAEEEGAIKGSSETDSGTVKKEEIPFDVAKEHGKKIEEVRRGRPHKVSIAGQEYPSFHKPDPKACSNMVVKELQKKFDKLKQRNDCATCDNVSCKEVLSCALDEVEEEPNDTTDADAQDDFYGEFKTEIIQKDSPVIKYFFKKLKKNFLGEIKTNKAYCKL